MKIKNAPFFGLALSVLLGFGSGFAQTSIPDTPAGKAFAGWLEAFNSGESAYRDFAQKNWPSGVKILDRMRDFRAMTGGFDLRKIDAASTPTTLVALVQERDSDQFGKLTLEVDPAEPHQILHFGVQAIPRPAEFPLPHLTMDNLIAAVGDKLQRQAAADRFSGVALLAKDGQSVFARAYGLADRERNIPNTLQTRFRIGSMNKMFTAVATMQLVQAGKLRLDAPLKTYLPDYPNKELAGKVTIQELLTHTGGTGDFFGPEFEAHRTELRTLADYVKLFGKRPVKFEPGSRWEYSNYGFILLGVVIERVTRQSYYDYVRKNIYGPTDMTATGSEPESQVVANRSIGYTNEGGALRPNTDTLPYRGTSAGGGYSTVEDLLRFANALRDHKLLDPSHTQLLTTGKVDMPGNGAQYAFGFGDRTVNGTRCIGHNGGAPGMNGDLAICTGSRYVVAVLANRDPNAAQAIADFITNRLPEN